MQRYGTGIFAYELFLPKLPTRNDFKFPQGHVNLRFNRVIDPAEID
jgi:hypothetical protein